MNSAHEFRANERVVQSLAEFAEERELSGLGDAALSVIGSELRKAGLENQLEDVFQNVLMMAWESCCRGAVRTIRPFFLAMSRYEARRTLRRAIVRERNDPKAQEWMALLLGDVSLPEEPEPDERGLLLQAIRHLTPERRRLMELMMIEGRSDAEAMAEMGLSAGAFRTAKCRAIKDLRGALRYELRGRQAGNRRRRAGMPRDNPALPSTVPSLRL